MSHSNLDIARQRLLAPAGIDEGDLNKVFGQLLGHAVDSGDLYFQSTRFESWVLEDGIVKEGAHSIEQGAGVRAITDSHHHDLMHTSQADNDFPDTRILCTGLGIQLLQQTDLVIRRHPVQRVQCRVQRIIATRMPGLQFAFIAMLCDGTGCC